MTYVTVWIGKIEMLHEGDTLNRLAKMSHKTDIF